MEMTLVKSGGAWFLETQSGTPPVAEPPLRLCSENERGSVAEQSRSTVAERLVFDYTTCALFQFLPKPNRMDTIVRQMTECGARFIIPVTGAYSPPGDAAKRLDRWNKIIREARQQSASPVNTEIVSVSRGGRLEAMTPGEACAWWASRSETQSHNALGVLLHETHGSMTLSGCLEQFRAAADNFGQSRRGDSLQPSLAAIVVGTEGGIRDDECNLFAAAGFLQVHFAVNILRVDTAALYGMSALQNVLMEGLKWKDNE
jgi:16S rRNA (uracil1498-N3)-methyltransferase